MGAKKQTLYERQVLPNMEYIERMARSGVSQADIAAAIKINPRTLDRYLVKYPELKKVIQSGREIAVQEIENAVFKSAIGFKEKVTRSIKVKKTVYKNGRRSGEVEVMEPYEEELYFPPNMTAAIFLLKNWGRNRKYASEPTAVELHYKELEMKEKMMSKDDIPEEEKVIIINDLNGDS